MPQEKQEKPGCSWWSWLKPVTLSDLRKELTKQKEEIMALLDDVVEDVTAQTTVVQSVVTLLQNLVQQLKDAGTDPVKLAALKTQLEANTKALADAVVASTPAAPPTP